MHRIIGIDPGTAVLGYAVIEIDKQDIKIISLGVIKLEVLDDHYERLKQIYERLTAVIKNFGPSVMAIETPLYAGNALSMLKLGRAQGVAITAAMVNDIPVTEYLPKKVKKSVTGNGNATKEQLADMLQYLLKFDTLPKYLDATDALGVALCHHYQSKVGITKSGKGNSWQAFIKENPNRLK
jgi:crossover junction endodeoxyribonuclease RuvC